MKSLNRWVYGPTPEEKVRAWQQKLRQEERQLEREALNVQSYPPLRPLQRIELILIQLDRATQKSRSELKVLAKKGDVKSARILAREVVRANKQKDRLMSSQARMKSIQMQLQHQLCELPMGLLVWGAYCALTMQLW